MRLSPTDTPVCIHLHVQVANHRKSLKYLNIQEQCDSLLGCYLRVG